MNLQQLNYFRTIARLENYTKAAEELLVAQSGLSRSMSELEEELGVPLFYRSGRHIHLTRYGADFLNYANQAIDAVENGKRAMQRYTDPEKGQIALAFGSSLSTHFIPQMIGHFHQQEGNRGIRFDLQELQTMEIIEAFRDNRLDLGFGYWLDTLDTRSRLAKTVADYGLDYYPVVDQKLLLAVAQNHPWAQRESIEIQELNGVDWINYSMLSGVRHSCDAILAGAGVYPNTVAEVQNDMLAACDIAAGFGVGLLADAGRIRDLPLALIPVNCADLTRRTIYMFWPDNDQMLPAVARFRDFVIENTKNHPGEGWRY